LAAGTTWRPGAFVSNWNPLVGVATMGRVVARYSKLLMASRLIVKSSTT